MSHLLALLVSILDELKILLWRQAMGVECMLASIFLAQVGCNLWLCGVFSLSFRSLVAVIYMYDERVNKHASLYFNSSTCIACSIEYIRGTLWKGKDDTQISLRILTGCCQAVQTNAPCSAATFHPLFFPRWAPNSGHMTC